MIDSVALYEMLLSPITTPPKTNDDHILQLSDLSTLVAMRTEIDDLRNKIAILQKQLSLEIYQSQSQAKLADLYCNLRQQAQDSLEEERALSALLFSTADDKELKEIARQVYIQHRKKDMNK